MIPQAIGFAGFYNAFPWLTFAPFDLDTAVGPLIYAYVCVLTTGRLGWLGRWIFLPVGIQFTYYSANFLRPTVANKWVFNDAIHEPYILPVLDITAFTLLLVGLAFAGRQYRRYLTWLGDATSSKAEFDARWLGGFLIVMSLFSASWVGYELIELIFGRLSYIDGYWFYPLLAFIMYAIGLGGLIGIVRPFPKMKPKETAESEAAQDSWDWSQAAAQLKVRVLEEGWYLEADLTAKSLALKMGTNETYLSRTINRGLEMNFNRFINTLRIETAQSALREETGKDILTIAYDSGFGSKATFNRVFKDMTGMTPAAWRLNNQS